MNIRILIILLSFVFVKGIQAQNNYISVYVELKAGAKIPGSIEKNIDFNVVEKVTLIDLDNAKKHIPLKAIEQIKSNNGQVLYPVSNTIKKNKFAKIKLKAGAEIIVSLKLDGQNPADLDKIPFVDDEGNHRKIPLAAISEIYNVYGEKIYPSETVLNSKVEEPKEEKDNCNSEGKKLKTELMNAFQNRYIEIDQFILNQTKNYQSASLDREEKLKKEIYALISEDVNELSSVNAMVKSVLRIYVDKDGNFVKVEDDVTKSENKRYYTILRDKEIYPKLKTIKYDVNETSLEFKDEYEKIYSLYKSRIESSSCPKSEFESILTDAKRKLDNKEKNIVPTYTVYSIPIEYNFSTKFQKWTYYNGDLKVKVNNNFVEITKPEVKEQFNSLFTKRQKNGKYNVNATYYSALTDETKINLNSVKRKYKYMTHFGVSVFAHIPIIRPLNFPLAFNNSFGDIYTFNAKVVFHRIGFFGGTMYNFNNYTIKNTGTYINQNFPTYGEGGIYVGLAQWFYLKAGYSYLKTDIGEYSNGVLLSNHQDQISHGFIAGMALIFPVINIEWGYNSNIGSFYVGTGLHISLNK